MTVGLSSPYIAQMFLYTFPVTYYDIPSMLCLPASHPATACWTVSGTFLHSLHLESFLLLVDPGLCGYWAAIISASVLFFSLAVFVDDSHFLKLPVVHAVQGLVFPWWCLLFLLLCLRHSPTSLSLGAFLLMYSRTVSSIVAQILINALPPSFFLVPWDAGLEVKPSMHCEQLLSQCQWLLFPPLARLLY